MKTAEVLLNIAFYAFAIGSAASAIAVATSKNIVRSAFALLGVLFSVAAMYAFLRADFIVAAQIIIYVGGILVLIMFAVMLTHKITNVKLSNEASPGPAAVFATLCMLFALFVVIAGANGSNLWVRDAAPERIAAGEGTGRAEASVWLIQADRATGVDVSRGEGLWLDGAGLIRASVNTAPAGTTLARVELSAAARERDGKYGEFAPKSSFALTPGEGGFSGEQYYTSLGEGRYRWTLRFMKDNDVLPVVLEGKPFVVEAGLTRPLGRALAGRYLLPFEAISVLLLAALVGAAYLARKEVRG